MKVASSFGQEGASADATITPSAEWLDQLCGWVRRAPGDLGPLVWPVLLMPQRIDPAFAHPNDARTVYQQVRWDEELPAGAVDLHAATTWVAAGSDGSQVAIASSGSSIAEGTTVVRTERALSAWGTGDVPPMPDLNSAERRLSFALTEHDVSAFAELSGVHEPIHEDAAHAWRLGLPNAVVQELTLLLIVMHVAPAPCPGSIEMWFLDPVPVGSILTLWQADGIWEVRLGATQRAVAIGRITGSGRPYGRCAFATSRG